MAAPTRIRASMQGDKVLVRVLMTHEMESGQRRDATGKVVPAHFIREVSVRHNGRTVLAAQWGPAVSKNPYLQFAFTGGKPGDRIQVTWVDSKGDTRTDEAAIA
jgi:sulfur-oxidizing protein SoxZ